MERVTDFERGVVMRLHHALLTVMLALGVAIPCVAQDVDQVRLETTQFEDSVFVISGGGGNIGVLTGPDGVLLIDTQMGQFGNKIRAAVAAVSDQPVRYIINTHWHFDHTGCNGCFAEDEPVIIGPEGTRERIGKQIADGLSVEEILSSHPTADTDEDRKMGMPPEVFVRIVHRDLTDGE